jgi:hypothetical protein
MHTTSVCFGMHGMIPIMQVAHMLCIDLRPPFSINNQRRWKAASKCAWAPHHADC